MWPLLDIGRGREGREEKLSISNSVCCRPGLETREVGEGRWGRGWGLVAEVSVSSVPGRDLSEECGGQGGGIHVSGLEETLLSSGAVCADTHRSVVTTADLIGRLKKISRDS